jgi:hypothetical protein
MLRSQAACTKCGTPFKDADATAAEKHELAHKLNQSAIQMLNANRPPKNIAYVGTASLFLDLLLHLVRRMGTYIAAVQFRLKLENILAIKQFSTIGDQTSVSPIF